MAAGGPERGDSRLRREKKHQRDGFCAVESTGRKDRGELLSLSPTPITAQGQWGQFVGRVRFWIRV